MFKFRKQQMEQMEAGLQASFHRRLATFLRQELPEETVMLPEDVLLGRIADGEQRAEAWGIETEAGVAQFLCLTFLAGPRFDAVPEVSQFLGEPGAEPEEKLEALIDYLAGMEDEQE